MKASSGAVLLQMDKAGLLIYAKTVITGDARVTGRMSLRVVPFLHKHPQFTPGIPAVLHGELGQPRVEWRSLRGAFGEDTSLQVVVNLKTGMFYADLDVWNPTEDARGFVLHNLVEVWGPKLKNLFRRKD